MWPLFFACMVPFVILFGSIFWLRKTVYTSAVAAVCILLIIVVTLWQMPAIALVAIAVKSILVTLDIVVILVTALFLIALLQEVGSIEIIKKLLIRISPDKRLQALIIGVFFVGFIEGIAGFGTPAMLAAPLLVAIGFPVRAAILVSLVGNTLTTAFGAVGTPFLIGLTQGLAPYVQLSSGNTEIVLQQTLAYFILLGAPLALALPFVLILILTQTFGGNWRDSLGIWKHAILAALCLVIPLNVIALVVGFEFPSLLGSILGGLVFVLLLKLPLFKVKTNWSFVSARGTNIIKQKQPKISLKSILFALLPYFIVVTLLVISRLDFLPIKKIAFESLAIPVERIGTITINHTIRPLYSPAFYLMLGSITGIMLYRPKKRIIKNLLQSTLLKSHKPTKTLLVLIYLAQLLLLSNNNTANNPSIPVFAATMVSSSPIAWPLLAPFVGMFGALITGSVTVSNILFADFQAQTAILGNYSIPLILALQVLGATGGNMIALHNIIAVLASTDPSTSEQKVVSLLLKPSLLYVICLGVIGYGVHVGMLYF